MKRLLVLILVMTVHTLVCLEHVAYSQKLDIGEPRTVRMIYFLPNDLPLRPDVVREMKNKIRTVQKFYAEQMQAHGYGNRTFRFETNARDQPKVHRVNGKYPFSHYDNTLGTAVIAELEQAFDFKANIYFIVLGADALRQGNGQPAGGVANQVGKNGGHVVVPNRFGWGTVAHELGHTFGLGHDFRDDSYMMSYSHQYGALSDCTAEFLSVHPYFNLRIPIAEVSPPTIELISSPTYPAGAKSIPVRLKVQDPNGVHQVQLFGAGGLQECRGLAGKKEAVIEFEYDGGIGLLDFDAGSVDITSFSDATTHNILVNVVDRHGNVSKKLFRLWEDSPYHIATLKIEDFIDDESSTLNGAIAFSPNGTLLATAIPQWIKGRKEGRGYITHPNHSIYLWNVKTQENIATFDLGDRRKVRSMVFSPDGGTFTSLSADGTIELWNVKTQENITIMKYEKRVYSHVLSPDGKTLVSGKTDGTIELWNVKTQENITTFKGHRSVSLPRLAISPDGNFLAVGVVDASVGGWTTDSSLHLWDLKTQRNIATLKESKGFWGMAFSPDNTLFATGTGNAEIKLWDMTTRKHIGDFSAGRNEVYTLAFSPDGTLLASASGGSEIKLWDVKTRMNITTLSGHLTTIPALTFSPDGTLLASAGDDGQVMLWDVAAAILIESKANPADANGDGSLNVLDLVLVSINFGKTGENVADVNGDKIVNIVDLVKVAGEIGGGAAAPAAHPKALEVLTVADVQHWLTQAQHLNLTDAISQRGILMLQQLLAALIPKETSLLPNYPNPFNPETWIPYQLAEDAEVTLTIYAADGRIVRTLALGQQSAGNYHSKSRAAYWDGRNAVGEPVASGVYFYTLTAGEFTATRKMLILK